MDLLYPLTGLIACCLIIIVRTHRKNSRLEVELATIKTINDERSSTISQLTERLETASAKNECLEEVSSSLKARVSQLTTINEQEQSRFREKLDLLESGSRSMKTEFENLANRIFQEKTDRLASQNRTGINEMLVPLKNQLSDFKKRVDDIHDKDAKDRAVLLNELSNLKGLNRDLGKEALNLTRALKGQSKTRGTWGEVVLEGILEHSGLTEGIHYLRQASISSGNGRRLQPDIIVRLPGGRDVVIDSKVSLVAHERACSAESKTTRDEAVKEHLQSMRAHVKSLSSKRYDELDSLRSLDFVLMFVPVEGAFTSALDACPRLFDEAFEKNVVIVGPSTLMVTLRTINNMWRTEDQNANAREIARRAGDLFDKFASFTESIEELGRELKKANDAYENAHSRLTSGRGNLVSRALALKELGVQSKKELPPSLRETPHPPAGT